MSEGFTINIATFGGHDSAALLVFNVTALWYSIFAMICVDIRCYATIVKFHDAVSCVKIDFYNDKTVCITKVIDTYIRNVLNIAHFLSINYFIDLLRDYFFHKL